MEATDGIDVHQSGEISKRDIDATRMGLRQINVGSSDCGIHSDGIK